MLPIDQELIDIALEGLANQKVIVDTTTKEVKALDKLLSKVTAKTAKDLAGLDNKLDVIQSEMQATVASEMSKIPVPKNGLDGRSITGPKGETGASIKGPVGPRGKDGKSIQGKQGVPGKSIKGEPGKDGKSIKGDKGKSGVDGVGIKSISSKDNKLKVTMTDGNVKEVALPSSNSPAMFGGVPSNPEISTLRNLADTNTSNASEGDVLSFVGGKWTNISSTSGTGGGNPFTGGTAEAFMFAFNAYESTHSADFVYNVDKQLISKSVVSGMDVLYLVTFTYVTGVLTEKLVTDMINNDSVETVFEYTDSLLTRKELTYIG